MDFDKSIILGLDNSGELVVIELNFHDLNRGTKWENDHYYLSFSGWRGIVDADTGEQEARERLEDIDYWEEIGYLNHTNGNNFLRDYIDFERVAEDVINNDGWYNTNGEYHYLTRLEDKEYFIDWSWLGRDKDKIFNKSEYKKIYINDDDFKFLSNLPKEIKPNSKELKEVNKIFSKYQDKQEVAKDMLEN